MAIQLALPTQQLADFCRRNAIRKLALFGSVLREDFRPDSDVDVLVEFEPTAHIGWELIDIQDALAELFDKEVDLHTLYSLSPSFRNEVLKTAQVLYERTWLHPLCRYADRSTACTNFSGGARTS